MRGEGTPRGSEMTCMGTPSAASNQPESMMATSQSSDCLAEVVWCRLTFQVSCH